MRCGYVNREPLQRREGTTYLRATDSLKRRTVCTFQLNTISYRRFSIRLTVLIDGKTFLLPFSDDMLSVLFNGL